jgi:phospholipase B1
MLAGYISFILACGLVSAAPQYDYTEAELKRVLGPYADGDIRIDFPCTDTGPSPTIPTSVHALRPADIQYIAAIGDSLTAASGGDALTIIGLLFEYRAVAWSIGGRNDLSSTITLPNILRKYNSNLYGYSTGTGNQNSTAAVFNVARPGAISIEMTGQANLLVNRMISSLGQQEFENAWKLVTIFIGANDLCDYCNDKAYYSAQAYRNNIKATLDVLYQRMPKTLVNFVTVLNVAELEDLHEGLICQGMQTFLCDCAINANTRPLVRAASLEYQKETNELIDSGIYNDRDDFTVVRQPFMEHMTVPLDPSGLPDFSYFAPDCFHFSKKGHGSAAIELWNNMMEPVGKKTTVWNLLDTLNCPTSAQGFIYTMKNSG